MRQEIFRMERVTYMEHEVLLLDDFNLQVWQGEILGMVYVNAHGLSALLKLFQTNCRLYDGYIYYGEEKINSWKGARKGHNRISVIEAQRHLVENMSVLDNIFVLRQGFRQEIIRKKLLRRQLAPFLEDIDMDIPVDTWIRDLSVFERLVVEVLRAVVMGNRLIVLNQIGSIISYEELHRFHDIIRHYASQGFSFLYISPHFEDTLPICGRVTIFSHGRIQKIIRKEEMEDNVLRLYPSEYDRLIRHRLEQKKGEQTEKKKILEVSEISGAFTKKLSFEVWEGECLAIEIQDNNMFHEASEMLTGKMRPISQMVQLNGVRINLIEDPHIAVLSELATTSMIFPELDYMNNLCMGMSRRVPAIWREKKLQDSVRREYGAILGEKVFHTPVERLSEKQKYQLIYTRILLQKPKVVFCIQPFKGADRSHRIFIWKMMEMLLNHKIAVVILSMNLSDALSLADRMLILNQNSQQELQKEDFASITETIPWVPWYRNEM